MHIADRCAPRKITDGAENLNAEVKKTWIYIFTSPYAFMAYCLVKHKDNFTVTQRNLF
jgi:hypothetical protein